MEDYWLKGLTYGPHTFEAATKKSRKKSVEARCLFRFNEIVIAHGEIPPLLLCTRISQSKYSEIQAHCLEDIFTALHFFMCHEFVHARIVDENIFAADAPALLVPEGIVRKQFRFFYAMLP